MPAITADVTDQNFTANSIHVYTVSGTITSGSGPVKGVKVTLDGIYTDTTNGNGNFAIRDVYDGTTGDLVPDPTGYTFLPSSIHMNSLTGRSWRPIFRWDSNLLLIFRSVGGGRTRSAG